MSFRVRVEAEVRPTEDETKVEKAIKNIFPTLRLSREGDRLVGESTEIAALDKIHMLLRRQKILDAARSIMLSGKGEKIKFMLNKQAAFVSWINFSEGESPLGPIVVTLEAGDLDRLINYLAPRTHEGKPIEEIEYREG